MSEETTTLAAKVAKAMGEIGAVKHDAKNTYDNYSYTSAAAVLAKAQRALSANGVAVSSQIETLHDEWTKSQQGKPQWFYCVKVHLTLSDGSGETLHAEGVGAGFDRSDKAPMKATTAALKYALSTALCIGLGDDPEADEQTSEDGPGEAPQRQRRGNGNRRQRQQGNGGGQQRAQAQQPEHDPETGEVITRTKRWPGGNAGVDIRQLGADELSHYRDTVEEWAQSAPQDKAPAVRKHLELVEIEIQKRTAAETATSDTGDDSEAA